MIVSHFQLSAIREQSLRDLDMSSSTSDVQGSLQVLRLDVYVCAIADLSEDHIVAVVSGCNVEEGFTAACVDELGCWIGS